MDLILGDKRCCFLVGGEKLWGKFLFTLPKQFRTLENAKQKLNS
jgi:hypothetical protein